MTARIYRTCQGLLGMIERLVLRFAFPARMAGSVFISSAREIMWGARHGTDGLLRGSVA